MSAAFIPQTEGRPYTPEEVDATREFVIGLRNAAMDCEPPRFDVAVSLSHVISILAQVKEQMQ